MLSTVTNFNQGGSSPVAQKLIETPSVKLDCFSSVEHFEFLRDFEDRARRILQDLEAKNAPISRDRSVPQRRIRRKKKKKKKKLEKGKRKKRRKNKGENDTRGRTNVRKRVRTHSVGRETASNFRRDPDPFSGIFRIEGIQTQMHEGSQGFGNATSQSHLQRRRSVATLPSSAQTHDFEEREARTFPDVVCRQSNTGLFSFFAFAILSLDLTANIMSTIDISVDIDIAGSAANSSTTINNTNTNTNTNTNENMNTNNNGRSLYSLDAQSFSSNPGGGGESPRIFQDSKGTGESPEILQDEGGDDYTTGEAGYPPQETVEERNTLKELLESTYERFLEVHQRVIMAQGRVHRRGFSQGFLQAWFEDVLDLYYALRE
ncbi:myb-like protein W [Penaeus indicus]|uniref:myb-like protein W n=1 Tax=Penaeus indicus TaxID=29960 RepID=UPI00300D1E1D